MSDMDKHYQILGLKPGVSEKEVLEAYKVLVKVLRPDLMASKGADIKTASKYF